MVESNFCADAPHYSFSDCSLRSLLALLEQFFCDLKLEVTEVNPINKLILFILKRKRICAAKKQQG